MKSKPASESLVTTTELVLPNDTNPLGNLMGGQLMHRMDLVAALSAQKHSGRIVVTKSVDNIIFDRAIKLGEAVCITAKVTRTFNSSMEVHLQATTQNYFTGEKNVSNSAFFTFVAVDQNGRPIDVPEVTPETEEEMRMFEGALRRRQMRLVLAGRLKPEDANEIKDLFLPKS